MIKPVVVSFSTTYHHRGIDRMRNSAEAWGWPVFIVYGQWTGFGGRLKTVLAQRSEMVNRGYTHMVHVDAFDVVCVGPPEDLADKLKGYGDPSLLVATEGAYWPNDGRGEQYPPHPEHHWKYCHSQFVLDLTKPQPDGLGKCADTYDDQMHLHDLFLGGAERMHRDLNCHVIQSIAHSAPWERFFEINDGRVRNRITGSMPLFIHGNGTTDLGWVPVKGN